MPLSTRAAIGGIVSISFALTLIEVPRSDWLTLATMSLAAGVTAIALMATTALLGGRLRLIESLFGGLDRVYVTHKWLAVWALVFAAFHFTFRAGMRGWEAAPILTWPPFYTQLVRQLSLLALVFILLLALNRRIPYQRWRWWHKLSGPLFLIVVLHWLTIWSPIEIASPAGVWLAILSAGGLAAAAYKLLLYRFASNHAEYRVAQATRAGSGLHLQLEPLAKPISFRPGQFCFVSMKEDGLREPHPFTIARVGSGQLHFVIRDLGDYTHRLIERTREGMHADVYGPFGRFERSPGGRREVWIAGGVGIAPFIAWLTDPSAKRTVAATLFYFFSPGSEFPTVERVRELASESGAEVVPMSEGPSDPGFTRRFEHIVNEAGPANVEIALCGPKGLLERVRAIMSRLGVPEANLRFEYFEFR